MSRGRIGKGDHLPPLFDETERRCGPIARAFHGSWNINHAVLFPVIACLFGLAMQGTAERSLSVVAVTDNVVWLKRTNGAAFDDDVASSCVAGNDLHALMERASHAARQMRYFGLATKLFSFSELIPSAQRAGFIQVDANAERQEATFRSPAGEPDLVFSVSFSDPAKVSTVAEARSDIFGLVLTTYSHVPTISVETNPSLKNEDLGPNALPLREVLLTYPDFDNIPAWTKYW
jgi:hypothetical protein